MKVINLKTVSNEVLQVLADNQVPVNEMEEVLEEVERRAKQVTVPAPIMTNVEDRLDTLKSVQEGEMTHGSESFREDEFKPISPATAIGDSQS